MQRCVDATRYVQSDDLLERYVPELLGDVIVTVGILKRQVELVVSLEQLQTSLTVRSRTSQLAALTVYIHLHTYIVLTVLLTV